MPATRYKHIKRAVAQLLAGTRAEVSRQEIQSSVGRTCEGFTLVIRRAKSRDDAKVVETGDDNGRDGKPAYHLFATNIPEHVVAGDPDQIVELYRRRRGVETGYRCYEEIRPKTTSRDGSVRMLLLFFPLLLYNAWVIARWLHARRHGGVAGRRITVRLLVAPFVDFTEDLSKLCGPPDTG